jgi:endo-1,4-beta-D-glucanase Y
MSFVRRRRALVALVAGGMGAAGTRSTSVWAQVTGANASSAVKSRAEGSDWPAWDAFRLQFISADGRVVDIGSPRSHTVSEGQAYALFLH